MKKYLLTIILSTINLISFSQIYGEFSLPHTMSVDTLNHFVGQRVKVPSNYGCDFHEIHMFERFSNHAKRDAIYTIKKVKINSKKITLFLSDQYGNKFKAKVNANKCLNYNTMTTCESFFLVDKYDNYTKAALKHKFFDESGNLLAQITDVKFTSSKEELPQPIFVVHCTMDNSTFEFKSIKEVNRVFGKLGTSIINKSNDTVAVVIGVKEYNFKTADYIYKFKNVYDNSVFEATMQDAVKNALNVGEVYSHPRVKHSYKIVGMNSSSQYIAINTISNQRKLCNINNIEEDIFSEDLSGKYVSVLCKVEKPSNPSIRYGKTETMESSSDITQYSYVDNVIDMLIIGDSKEFSFTLKNISDNTIKIIWDEAVFVNFDGSTEKVMHKGIKFSEKDGAKPATTIIRNAKLEDTIIPTHLVYYREAFECWDTYSMYPREKGLKPGQIRLMLPIQIKDVINEYVFVFDVIYVYNHPEVLYN